MLPPVLAGQARLAAHVSPAGESGHIRWCAAPGPPPAVDAVETECMALLSVLAEALFRQRPDTLAGFGAAFWAGFVQAYTAAFLGQVAGANLAVLQGRQEAARAMEAQAVALGLAAPGVRAQLYSRAHACVHVRAHATCMRHISPVADNRCGSCCSRTIHRLVHPRRMQAQTLPAR